MLINQGTCFGQPKADTLKIRVYPQDIMQWHEVCYKTAQDFLKTVKEHFNREDKQNFVSTIDYCKYMGYKLEDFHRIYLNKKL